MVYEEQTDARFPLSEWGAVPPRPHEQPAANDPDESAEQHNSQAGGTDAVPGQSSPEKEQNSGGSDRVEPAESNLPADSIDPRLLSLAMAFVPVQSWERPYDSDVALARGTIFPSLDMPFLGEEAIPR